MNGEFAHPGARVAMAALDHNLVALQDARSLGLETDPDRAEKLMPWIGQALFWTVTVDDLLLQAHKGHSYREKRDADPDGRYLDGARFARNAVAHGAIVLHHFQHGMTFPMTFPMTFGEVRCRSPPQQRRLRAQRVPGKRPQPVRRHMRQIRYVKLRAAGAPAREQGRRARPIDVFLPKIEELVEWSAGRIRVDVVHERLVVMGFEGSERTTRRTVAEAKAQYAAGRRRVFRPWVVEPGLWLQWDYGKGPRAAAYGSLIEDHWDGLIRYHLRTCRVIVTV